MVQNLETVRKSLELESIESTLGIKLPSVYRQFILNLGYGDKDCKLIGSDCFLQHLIVIQGWAVELLRENKFPLSLPEDAFVFLMHQGYCFYFFRLSEKNDPRVLKYMEGDQGFKLAYLNFTDFSAKYMRNVEIE